MYYEPSDTWYTLVHVVPAPLFINCYKYMILVMIDLVTIEQSNNRVINYFVEQSNNRVINYFVEQSKQQSD